MLIKLCDHTHNDDPDAVLVTKSRYSVGRDIFKHRDGYVACMPASMAVPGTFPSVEKAQAAQRMALHWSEAVWGRLTAERATSLDNDELERILGPCVCGPQCVVWAKALRDGGALTIRDGVPHLERPAS